jgi:hypothetical protein
VATPRRRDGDHPIIFRTKNIQDQEHSIVNFTTGLRRVASPCSHSTIQASARPGVTLKSMSFSDIVAS